MSGFLHIRNLSEQDITTFFTGEIMSCTREFFSNPYGAEPKIDFQHWVCFAQQFSNGRLSSLLLAASWISGPRTIPTWLTLATISGRVTSYMRDGKNDISSRITNRTFSVLALLDSIVRFLFSDLTIDVSYQKSTGSITGWYYHKNSELYLFFYETLLIAGIKNSLLRYRMSLSFLTYSIAQERKGNFPFTNFDDIRMNQ